MRLAIILLMCGAAWGQMPTVQEICAVMEPANRAKTEACTHMQQSDKHSVRKDPRNFVDAPPITQTRDIPAGDPAVMNIVTKPGCEATVENGNIIVAPTKAEDHQADTTSNVTAIVTCPPDRMCDARTGKPIDQPRPDTTSCIRGVTCSVTESGDKLVPACPKYQHFEPAHEEDCSNSMYGCWRHVADRCVDEIHLVTEREWQEVLARLKALEGRK